MGRVENATPLPLYAREWPATQCIRGWVNLRAGLDGYGKSRPLNRFHHRTVPPIARCYTTTLPRPMLPQWDKCLSPGEYVEVRRAVRTSHSPCTHPSQNKVLVIDVLLACFTNPFVRHTFSFYTKQMAHSVHAVTWMVTFIPVIHDSRELIYRVSIKSFPDYKHLLQENYCTWNTIIYIYIYLY